MCKELTHDQIKNLYSYFLQYPENFHGESASAYLLRLTSKYIKGKVVDFGAGTGALIKLIPGAIGIDLNEVPERNVIAMDIVKTDFPDGMFQTLFCSEVIEHLPSENVIKALKEIYRVLSPDSYAIFTTPYKENLLLSMAHCPICSTTFHLHGHVRKIDEKFMKDHLSAVGFKIKEIMVEPINIFAHVNRFSRLLRRLMMKYTKRWDNQRNLIVIAYKK